ncbi:MAG: ABC transporter substrate-binding protein, partial [Deltaproteobacteria bacterium]
MKLVLGILTALILLTSAGANPADAQALKKIRIGYPSLSFRQSNVWVAKEMGLFNKYGLEVEPIFLRGGQMATQALVAGDPPIVNIGTVVQASLQGYNLVVVAAVETKYDQIVFARKGVNKLEELKGKKFGISGFGSATHNAANILFQHLNLEVNKDVALVPAGPDAERLGAMLAGSRCDVLHLFSGSTGAKERLRRTLLRCGFGSRSTRQWIRHVALVHRKQPGHRKKRAQGFRRSDLLCVRQQEGGA